MKPITRAEIPTVCPRCGNELESHTEKGVTRKVCSVHCKGYEIVVDIDHNLEFHGHNSAIMMLDLENKHG